MPSAKRGRQPKPVNEAEIRAMFEAGLSQYAILKRKLGPVVKVRALIHKWKAEWVKPVADPAESAPVVSDVPVERTAKHADTPINESKIAANLDELRMPEELRPLHQEFVKELLAKTHAPAPAPDTEPVMDAADVMEPEPAPAAPRFIWHEGWTLKEYIAKARPHLRLIIGEDDEDRPMLKLTVGSPIGIVLRRMVDDGARLNVIRKQWLKEKRAAKLRARTPEHATVD